MQNPMARGRANEGTSLSCPGPRGFKAPAPQEPTDIRKLTYAFSSKDGGAKGTCKVHRISKDADAIREFGERLWTGLRYEGEGIPHATGKAILSVLRPVREQLHPDRRAMLYAEHGEGVGKPANTARSQSLCKK